MLFRSVLGLTELSVEIDYSQIYIESKKPFAFLQEKLTVIKSDQITLLELLKPFMDKGYLFNSHMFLYWSLSRRLYMYCGSSDTMEESFINLSDISNNTVKLRCRRSAEIQEKQIIKNKVPSNNGKPVKDRKISEIIRKVTKWRKLYTGTAMPDGRVVKYSSKEAANMIGIAKKTLDDYLLQMRIGMKYGLIFFRPVLQTGWSSADRGAFCILIKPKI